MRVAIDISPLVQTRAGTARHVRGLVGADPDDLGPDPGQAAALLHHLGSRLAGVSRSLLGTSHRQAPVKAVVKRVRDEN